MPGGWVDDGEDRAAAIAREVEEETGWRPGPVTELGTWFNMPGISDARCTLYRADGATRIGSPEDASEAARVEWLSLRDAPRLIADRHITDADTLIALSLARATA